MPVKPSEAPAGIFRRCCSRGHIRLRAPYGLTRLYTVHVRGQYETRKGAVRHPYGQLMELTQPELAKIPHGRRIWPYGARTVPTRAPNGLFTGWLQYLNPYGARKLIMHAFKLYGPVRGGKIRTAPHGPVRAPWVDVRFLFPYGARECDVIEAWDASFEGIGGTGVCRFDNLRCR